MNTGPLEGLNVLDLSRVMSGPYATMLLGDYGARVIKVEEPEKGDETRFWYPPKIGDQSAYFLSANRNKESVKLNLKSEKGLEIFDRLASKADVIVENFRPGVADALGVGYSRVGKTNPKVVYCSISGFGQTGPNRNLPGYDLVVFAMGGIMSFTGEPNRPPIRLSIPIADLTAGLFAVTAILAALNYRNSTGLGQYIDLSMQDVQVSLLTHQAMNYFATGKNPEKIGSMHPNLTPYGAFRASDGYFVLTIGNDKLWTDFCKEIGRPDLSTEEAFRTNPSRLANRAKLNSILERLFEKETVAFWLESARKARVPAAKILNVSDVVGDPHIQFREMIRDLTDQKGAVIKQIGTPVKFSRSKATIRSAPPTHGEHTRGILRELGYSEEEIAKLRSDGTV